MQEEYDVDSAERVQYKQPFRSSEEHLEEIEAFLTELIARFKWPPQQVPRNRALEDKGFLRLSSSITNYKRHGGPGCRGRKAVGLDLDGWTLADDIQKNFSTPEVRCSCWL